LFIGTPAGLPAMAANLTSYQVLGNIGVNRGGLLNLNGQVENVFNLVLNEGGDVQTTTGVLFLLAGGSIQVFPGLVSDGSTIAGHLEIDAGSHNIIVAEGPGLMGAPGLDISAVISSSGGSITLRKINSGKLRLSAVSTYAGSARVDAGILQMDGLQTAAVVVSGGARLMGTGRAGPVTFTSSLGVVAPGRSPGILQVGHFNTDASGGTLELELNGPVAGTDYDRLSVRGLADLTGMNLQASVNFAASDGQEFTILGNDGFDAITGEFTGLPEGAELRLGDQIFQITYLGGDGNDVVLTKTGDVYRPVLTIQRISPVAVRLGWPTNDPAFTLQFTTNLNSASPGNDWTFVTEMPAVSGTNVIVMQNTTGPQKFYRLFKP
jgi:autotransporter-associated beta strand protein